MKTAAMTRKESRDSKDQYIVSRENQRVNWTSQLKIKAKRKNRLRTDCKNKKLYGGRTEGGFQRLYMHSSEPAVLMWGRTSELGVWPITSQNHAKRWDCDRLLALQWGASRYLHAERVSSPPSLFG